jgi:hypothetical protein
MGGGPDLDAWLEKIRGCEVLAEDELKLLCEFVRCFAFQATPVFAVYVTLDPQPALTQYASRLSCVGDRDSR